MNHIRSNGVGVSMLHKRAARLAIVMSVLALMSCGRTPPECCETKVPLSCSTVDATADVGLHSSLAVDSRGRPSIAYYDLTNGDLKYAEYTGQQPPWRVNVIDSEGDVGGYASLAIDSENRPHITYHQVERSGGQIKSRIRYIWRSNTGGWSPLNPAQSDNAPPGGRYSSLAIDFNDVSYLSYVAEPKFSLEIGFCSAIDTECNGYVLDDGTTTTGAGGNINGHTKLLLRQFQSSQVPVVVYYQASYGVLQTMYLEPGNPDALAYPEVAAVEGWVPKVLAGRVEKDPNAPSDVGLYVDAAIEEATGAGGIDADVLHVTYYDAENQDLHYLTYNFATQERHSELVDDDGLVGQGASLALLPPNGDYPATPVIAYYDGTQNALRLAIREFSGVEPSGWKIVPIAFTGISGTFPSIKPLDNRRVGVSFYDFSSSLLRYCTATVRQ